MAALALVRGGFPVRGLSLIMMFLLLLGAGQKTGVLRVQTPGNMDVVLATAQQEEGKESVRGAIDGPRITFENLAADEKYAVKLELRDGIVVQGVDMGWYNEEPDKPDRGELSDDDRTAIAQIVAVPSFYNKSDILAVRGNHDRATVLVQLIRDKDFYNGNGQAIWRVELWYFHQEFGGWEKVAQQNKVLRRERFQSRELFSAAVAKLKWEPRLGSIRIDAPAGEQMIDLTPPSSSTTQP
jgi:hypothetical protein